MNRKILTIVGALALLLWTVGGVAAWALTKEGMQVTVQEGTSRADEGEGMRLLEDRVATLETDLRALTATLETNFQALVEASKQDGDARARQLEAHIEAQLSSEVQAVTAALAAAHEERRQGARDRIARTERATANLLAALHRIEVARSVAASTPQSKPTPATPHPQPPSGAQTEITSFPPPASESLPPPAARPPAITTVSSRPAAASPPPHPAAPAARTPAASKPAGGAPRPDRGSAPVATKPARRSFLSFHLPSQDVSFSKRQHWRFVPSLSRVGFDGTSTLHGFSGVTSKLSGTVDVDLSHPSADPHAEIHVQAGTLKTGIDERDAEMRAALGTRAHPEMVFRLVSFTPRSVDAKAERVQGIVHGQMTIHGTTHEVDMPTTLSLDASRRLHIDGEMRLDMSAYHVNPPSKLGVINVDKIVKLWIRLRARVQRGS